MSDRLRDVLEALAERVPPADPDDFAARVLASAAPARRRWLVPALAAAAAVVAGVLVVADDEPEERVVTTPTSTLPTTTLPPTVPTTTATPSTTAMAALTNWRRAALEGASFNRPRFRAVAASARGVVAVGSDSLAEGTNQANAAVWLPDKQDLGGRWSPVSGLGSPAHEEMAGVVAVDDGFVAVGLTGPSYDDSEAWRAAVWRSPDGRSWTKAVIDGSAQESMASVARRGGRLVAVGSHLDRGSTAVAWYSDDQGRTWARATVEGGDRNRADAVTAAPNGFVMVGTAIWISPDGVRWTEAEAKIESGQVLFDVTHGAAGLIAVGNDSNVWLSSDGRRWAQAPKLSDAYTLADVLALSDGSWLLGGIDGMWRSLNGRRWARVAFGASEPLYGSQPRTGSVSAMVQRGDGAVVAVGYQVSEVAGGPRPPTVITPAVWVTP